MTPSAATTGATTATPATAVTALSTTITAPIGFVVIYTDTLTLALPLPAPLNASEPHLDDRFNMRSLSGLTLLTMQQPQSEPELMQQPMQVTAVDDSRYDINSLSRISGDDESADMNGVQHTYLGCSGLHNGIQ